MGSTVQNVGKQCYFTTISRDNFLNVVGMLEVGDIPVICRISKAVSKLFEVTPAVIFKEQISVCQRITSFKTLGKQVKGLDCYDPQPEPWTTGKLLWTLLPHLKSIDFSQNPATTFEINSLLFSFNELNKSHSGCRAKVKEIWYEAHWANEEGEWRFPALPLQPQRVGRREAGNFVDIYDYGYALGMYTFYHAPEEYTSIYQEDPYHRRYICEREYLHTGQIEYLDFGNEGTTYIQRNLISFLRSFCPRLTHFKMQSPASKQDNYYLTLYMLRQHQTSLTHFELASDKPPDFMSIGFSPRQLAHFSPPYYELPNVLSQRALSCPQLRHARIVLRHRSDVSEVVEALNTLAQQCPHLQFLEFVYLSEDRSMHASLIKALQQFPNLTGLKLNVAQQEMADDVLKNFKKLKHVYFVNFSCTLQNLAHLAPDLEELTLNSPRKPDQVSLLFAIFHLPKLEKVSVSYFNKYDEFTHIVDLMLIGRQIRRKNCCGRLLYQKYANLCTEFRDTIYRLVRPMDIEDDIGALGSISYPFISLKGNNLFEQLAWQEFEKLILKNLSGIEKNVFAMRMQLEPFAACLRIKEIDQEKLFELYEHESRPLLKLNLVSALSDAYKIPLSAAHEMIEQNARIALDIVDKMRLQLDETEQLMNLLNKMKDTQIAHPQLLETYRQLPPDLQTKLSYQLWVEQGKPNDDRPINGMVQANVRCLQPFIPKMIEHRQFKYRIS